MNVLIDVQECVGYTDNILNTRGIPQYELNLLDRLLQRKAHSYTLAFFDHKGENGNRQRAQERLGKYDVPIVECNEIMYPDLQKDDLPKSYEEYLNCNADVIWFPHFLKIPKKFNSPAVATVHDLLFFYHGTVYGFDTLQREYHKTIISLNKILANNVQIAAISNYAKNEILGISHLFDESSIEVVYNSCNEAEMYPDYDKSALKKYGIDVKYILSIGRLERKKNQINIIRAFNILAKEFSDVKLVLVGRNPITKNGDPLFPTVTEMIEHSPFKERIIVAGICSEAEKRLLLSNAEALIFPSLHEGFGLPILEAMRCGCPVITSNITACPEILGDAGLAVNPLDATAIKKAMADVLSIDGLKEKMRHMGLERAKEFSWDNACQQMEQLFEKAARRSQNDLANAICSRRTNK